MVWKLDRLGRSLSHLLSTVNELKARGIAFRSLTEQMDTTTPQGEFLFHVFGALAQVAVAGIDVAPGVDNGDHRLARVVRRNATHGCRTGAVAERSQIVGAIPAVTAQ